MGFANPDVNTTESIVTTFSSYCTVKGIVLRKISNFHSRDFCGKHFAGIIHMQG